jgi:hypothetical protein
LPLLLGIAHGLFLPLDRLRSGHQYAAGAESGHDVRLVKIALSKTIGGYQLKGLLAVKGAHSLSIRIRFTRDKWASHVDLLCVTQKRPKILADGSRTELFFTPILGLPGDHLSIAICVSGVGPDVWLHEYGQNWDVELLEEGARMRSLGP